MGFLDNLIKTVNSIVENGKEAAEALSAAKTDSAVPVSAKNTYSENVTTSGSSFGAVMPAEANQYNYPGSYEQYFESIFAEKLGGYEMEKEKGKWGNTIYTFSNGPVKVLVVELLSESSTTQKVRSDCLKARVPYLRFYYNHQGWWNTYTYVTGRIAGALK